jgi:hypothetical protein
MCALMPILRIFVFITELPMKIVSLLLKKTFAMPYNDTKEQRYQICNTIPVVWVSATPDPLSHQKTGGTSGVLFNAEMMCRIVLSGVFETALKIVYVKSGCPGEKQVKKIRAAIHRGLKVTKNIVPFCILRNNKQNRSQNPEFRSQKKKRQKRRKKPIARQKIPLRVF